MFYPCATLHRQTDSTAVVKNWSGRKGLQYLETLTTMEKEMHNTLEAYLRHYQISLSLNTMRQLNHYNSENYTNMMTKM